MCYKEQFLRFWKSSVEHRLPPAPNVISTDWIFMKISPEIDLGTKEFPLNFRSHLESVVCQGQTIPPPI